ncbi:uncharacterized protein LOC131036683 [Cryptomeria japonica]|uniref:uncharacterized protein LOC131036683 n=1 Tax=Cryptomeria japonica TaxID=3369 RepID=UPI0025AD732F|nr:uncharacterized protein LOC131036683 [Cryptomeria japonica]
MDRSRIRKDVQSLTASMVGGGTLGRRSEKNNNTEKHRNTNNRLNTSMDGSGARSLMGGLSSVKTKLTDGLRFSKARVDNCKAPANDRVSSASKKNIHALERAFIKGCSLDAGNPSSNPLKVVAPPDVGHRKSLDQAVLEILGQDGYVKKTEERVWEAQKRTVGGHGIELRSVHVETDIAESVAQQVNARVRAADMPSKMQAHAFRCARAECDNHHTFSSKHMAFTLKKEFDRAYGPAWHCIVGTSFGSFVTFSVGGFLYFSIDKVSVLLFQTAVERLG